MSTALNTAKKPYERLDRQNARQERIASLRRQDKARRTFIAAAAHP